VTAAGRAAVPVAFLTQHGKEAVVRPALERPLGWRVERAAGFDTDRLGTFTRDVPRRGGQLHAARLKARLATSLTGCPRGLGSEGSFGPHPVMGLVPWNVELLVYVDRDRSIEVVGRAEAPSRALQRRVRDWTGLEALARDAGFPRHRLAIRPDAPDDSRPTKGIRDWKTLRKTYELTRRTSASGHVYAETDCRSHCNPARRAVIAAAARDLAARMQSCCPDCGAPGYWCLRNVPGLPCRWCLGPTGETLQHVYGCVRCTRRESVLAVRPGLLADPAHCERCNP